MPEVVLDEETMAKNAAAVDEANKHLLPDEDDEDAWSYRKCEYAAVHTLNA